MVDVSFYSVIGFLCAFAPNFTVLVILRLLYGMGGEWGQPRCPWRRFQPSGVASLSGLLQEATRWLSGWASVAARQVVNWLGQRGGGCSPKHHPGLISLIIRYRVKN